MQLARGRHSRGWGSDLGRFTACSAVTLEGKLPRPRRACSRIPVDVREQALKSGLRCPELLARELATRFTGLKKYLVSEAPVHRLLKAHDLTNEGSCARQSQAAWPAKRSMTSEPGEMHCAPSTACRGRRRARTSPDRLLSPKPRRSA